MAKKWYKSKTMWFNVLAIAGVLIQLLCTKEVQVEWITIEGCLIAIINVILRVKTNTGLEK